MIVPRNTSRTSAADAHSTGGHDSAIASAQDGAAAPLSGAAVPHGSALSTRRHASRPFLAVPTLAAIDEASGCPSPRASASLPDAAAAAPVVAPPVDAGERPAQQAWPSSPGGRAAAVSSPEKPAGVRSSVTYKTYSTGDYFGEQALVTEVRMIAFSAFAFTYLSHRVPPHPPPLFSPGYDPVGGYCRRH